MYFPGGFLTVNVSSPKGNCLHEIDPKIFLSSSKKMSNIREDLFFWLRKSLKIVLLQCFAFFPQAEKVFAHPQGYIRTSLLEILEHFSFFLLEAWEANYVMSFLSSRFFSSFILFSVAVFPHFLPPLSPSTPNIFFQDHESAEAACAPCAIFRTRHYFFLFLHSFFLHTKSCRR